MPMSKKLLKSVAAGSMLLVPGIAFASLAVSSVEAPAVGVDVMSVAAATSVAPSQLLPVDSVQWVNGGPVRDSVAPAADEAVGLGEAEGPVDGMSGTEEVMPVDVAPPPPAPPVVAGPPPLAPVIAPAVAKAGAPWLLIGGLGALGAAAAVVAGGSDKPASS